MNRGPKRRNVPDAPRGEVRRLHKPAAYQKMPKPKVSQLSWTEEFQEEPKKIETEADLSPLACWHAPPCSFLHWHGSIESRSTKEDTFLHWQHGSIDSRSTMEDIEHQAFAERSGAPGGRGSAAAWPRAAVHGNKTGSCWNRMFGRRYRW